jgi:hypothetical protein
VQLKGDPDMSTVIPNALQTTSVSRVTVPDSTPAREATEMIRDNESPLLFTHSTHVYHFGSLVGKRRGVKFDPELLYVGAMSRHRHDVDSGLRYRPVTGRLEGQAAESRVESGLQQV